MICAWWIRGVHCAWLFVCLYVCLLCQQCPARCASVCRRPPSRPLALSLRTEVEVHVACPLALSRLWSRRPVPAACSVGFSVLRSRKAHRTSSRRKATRGDRDRRELFFAHTRNRGGGGGTRGNPHTTEHPDASDADDAMKVSEDTVVYHSSTSLSFPLMLPPWP